MISGRGYRSSSRPVDSPKIAAEDGETRVLLRMRGLVLMRRNERENESWLPILINAL